MLCVFWDYDRHLPQTSEGENHHDDARIVTLSAISDSGAGRLSDSANGAGGKPAIDELLQCMSEEMAAV